MVRNQRIPVEKEWRGLRERGCISGQEERVSGGLVFETNDGMKTIITVRFNNLFKRAHPVSLSY